MESIKRPYGCQKLRSSISSSLISTLTSLLLFWHPWEWQWDSKNPHISPIFCSSISYHSLSLRILLLSSCLDPRFPWLSVTSITWHQSLRPENRGSRQYGNRSYHQEWDRILSARWTIISFTIKKRSALDLGE